MAHTKSGGSTRLGRDSAAKRLGVKRYAGERVNAGEILIRQRGSQYLAGGNVRQGGDDTLYAAKTGVVAFSKKRKICFDGFKTTVTVVNVLQS